MVKVVKIAISLFCIALGYIFCYISWGGIYDFGNPVNTILFCCSTPLIIGGFVYFIVVLTKRKKPVVNTYINSYQDKSNSQAAIERSAICFTTLLVYNAVNSYNRAAESRNHAMSRV